MAIQTINIGNQVNDGLGDDLRSAFQKVNANFAELNASLTVTASNFGTTGAGIFKQKVGPNLEFKRLVAGSKMLINDLADSVIINNTQDNAFTRIDTNNGTVLANDYLNITIEGDNGAQNITTRVVGSVISIDTAIPVTNILTSFDFGPISTNYETAIQFTLAAANIDFGTCTNPGTFSLDLNA